MDPDVITGYNIQNFDLPYLISRAQTLKVGQVGWGGLPSDSPLWGLRVCRVLRVQMVHLSYLQPTAPSGSKDILQNPVLAPCLSCSKSRRSLCLLQEAKRVFMVI